MADPVTYTAVLPISRHTVERIAVLLHEHRRALRTRSGRRSLGCFTQAVLFCRWMLQASRVRQLAVDHHVSLATAYRYLAEILDVLAEQAPGLRGALLAAKIAGYRYVMLDGTLIPTDRCSAPGPTQGVDLWWSGKHHRHGGNIQVITAPDGWPIWVSPVRPGREHDVTCARTHPDLLDAVDAFSVEGRFVLGDLGYEGEDTRLATPYKQKTAPKRKGSKKRKKLPLTEAQKVINTLHARLRSRAEQGNARLKVTFEALRHVSFDPWRIGAIAAAALVLLHWEHDRTT